MSTDFYVVTRTGVVRTNKLVTKRSIVTCSGIYIMMECGTPFYFLGNKMSAWPLMNYALLHNNMYALTPSFFHEVLKGRNDVSLNLNNVRSWCTEFRDHYYKARILPLPEELCRIVYDHLSNASRSVDDWCAQSDCDLRCE